MTVEAFDRDELLRMGVEFETEAETELFLALLTEELKRRIEKKGVSLDEPDSLEDDDFDIDDMFDDSEADREFIARSCRESLRREVVQYREQIAGRKPGFPEEVLRITLEELDLSIRSFNCLKRAGMRTVADILAHGDLCDIRNLGRRNVDEIEQALHTLGVK